MKKVNDLTAGKIINSSSSGRNIHTNAQSVLKNLCLDLYNVYHHGVKYKKNKLSLPFSIMEFNHGEKKVIYHKTSL